MANKNVMIVDVEGLANSKPYNIGAIVADCYGNVFEEFSWGLLDCVWDNLRKSNRLNESDKAKAMTHTNIEEILQNNKKFRWCTTDEWLMEFIRVVEKYGIKEVWAYNCAFDRGAIEKRLLNFPLSKLLGFKWIDIMPPCINSICCTPKYVEFALSNGFVTDKGNIKSSAESIYAYMTSDNQFVEEHQGLADVKIEYQLYLICRNKHTKIHNVKGNWRTIKDYREKKGY